MHYLISCVCGHSVDHHDQRGCEGERHHRCICRRDRGAALDSAVNVNRTRSAIRPPARYQPQPQPAVFDAAEES
jgi:hypothetical protein